MRRLFGDYSYISILCQHCVFRRFQNTLQTTEQRKWQDDTTILKLFEIPAQEVSYGSYESGKVV